MSALKSLHSKKEIVKNMPVLKSMASDLAASIGPKRLPKGDTGEWTGFNDNPAWYQSLADNLKDRKLIESAVKNLESGKNLTDKQRLVIDYMVDHIKEDEKAFQEFSDIFTPYEKKHIASKKPASAIDAYNQVKHIDGIYTEICGIFLWVTGNTYPHKETFKAIGFKWSGKKQAWYWRPEGYVKKGRRQFSLDEIRMTYGSYDIEDKQSAL